MELLFGLDIKVVLQNIHVNKEVFLLLSQALLELRSELDLCPLCWLLLRLENCDLQGGSSTTSGIEIRLGRKYGFVYLLLHVLLVVTI